MDTSFKLKFIAMRLLLFSLLISINFTGFSQTFPDFIDHPLWHVFVWEDSQSGLGYTKTVQYLKDTNTCDYDYSIIIDDNKRFYIRNDAERTYLKVDNNCSSKEYLLYDFSANLGDTLYVGYSFDFDQLDTIPVKLDSIYTIENNGFNRKVIRVIYSPDGDFNFFREMSWISGVGSTFHPIYSLFHNYDFLELNYSLLCYDSLDFNIYKNKLYNTCDTIINNNVGIKEVKNSIRIFPNPINEFLNLQCDNIVDDLFITLYDLTGDILIRQSYLNGYIDTSRLSPGFMILAVHNQAGLIIHRQIIIKIT